MLYQIRVFPHDIMIRVGHFDWLILRFRLQLGMKQPFSREIIATYTQQIIMLYIYALCRL